MNETSAHPPQPAGQNITVIMPSSRNGRRFALVSTLLSEMKYAHTAVFPPLRRLKLKGLEAKAVSSTFCNLAWRNPKRSDVLITDQNIKNENGKTIQISYDFMAALKEETQPDTLFLPILFHPSLLNRANYLKAEQLSKNMDRPIGVLFAGNCDPKTYDNSRIGSLYNLANRHELFEYVKSLPPELVFIPKTKEAFTEALESGSLKNKFVWIDTEAFRIPQNEWFELLAKSRYFFCTPGVHYPYCQNHNEAAACGAVPILQYLDFYKPGLINGENCLAFREINEIEKLLAKALSAENHSASVHQSTSINNWHKAHMSLEYATKQLSDFLSDPERKHMTWILAGK